MSCAISDLPDFKVLWQKRTTLTVRLAMFFELLAVDDLVQAKKTQREKDWPVIDALVEGHYRSSKGTQRPNDQLLVE